MIIHEDLQEDGWIGSLGVWRLDPIDEGSCQLIPFINLLYDYYVGWDGAPISSIGAREQKLQDLPVDLPAQWSGIAIAAGANDDEWVDLDNLFQDIHRSYVDFVLYGEAWQLDQLGQELKVLGAVLQDWQSRSDPEVIPEWNSETEPNSYWWPSWPELMPPRDQWDSDPLYFAEVSELLGAWGQNLEERARALDLRPNGAKPGPETAALVCFSTVAPAQGPRTSIFPIALVGLVLWGVLSA